MWKRLNNLLYFLYFWYKNKLIRSGQNKKVYNPLDFPCSFPEPILYVSTGQIGDLVLATGHLKFLRDWFYPHPIWLLGNPSIQPVVKPFIDIFIPISNTRTSLTYRGLTSHSGGSSILNRRFKYIIADIHTFYGGLFRLELILNSLQAERKFIYEGYYLGSDLAPVRPYPRKFEIIPTFKTGANAVEPSKPVHILQHNEYYFDQLLKRLGIKVDNRPNNKPDLGFVGSGIKDCIHYGLVPGDFVGWQPYSNNGRKNYPLLDWQKIISAFPDQQFVAFVEKKRDLNLNKMGLTNLSIITAELPVIMRLIQETRCFVGLDSGLSHIATALGKPTICVTGDSHLGYFFPYPKEYGYTNLSMVFNSQYLKCRGCFMTCEHEVLTSTLRKGALCLRTITPQTIIDSINDELYGNYK